MFSHDGPVACRVYSEAAMVYDKHNSRDSKQILLSDKYQQLLVMSCALGWSLISMFALLWLSGLPVVDQSYRRLHVLYTSR